MKEGQENDTEYVVQIIHKVNKVKYQITPSLLSHFRTTLNSDSYDTERSFEIDIPIIQVDGSLQ